MPEATTREIKLFYCYSREDKALRDELELHLSNLKRQYHLINWHDREILPGENWERTIDAHLSTANIILLLISPHFMASDYCYGKEMAKALEREKAVPVMFFPFFYAQPTAKVPRLAIYKCSQQILGQSQVGQTETKHFGMLQ